MQCKASSFMPINPSTDPAVYNTGSLKCIRAGLPAFSSLSAILFLLLVGDLAPLAVATLSPCCSTPNWPLYSLANTPKWNGLHAPPQHTIYHLPHASLVSFLHPLLAWFCTPSRCNFTPVLLSEPPPLPSSFSTSSLPTDQGCRLLDYAGAGGRSSHWL